VLVPQIGSFRSATTGVVTPFTGNVVIQSYQVTVNHQLGFVPFVGYSFDRSYVYGGIGPSLTQVDAKLNNTVGFASIGGVSSSITGTPTSYSKLAMADRRHVRGRRDLLPDAVVVPRSRLRLHPDRLLQQHLLLAVHQHFGRLDDGWRPERQLHRRRDHARDHGVGQPPVLTAGTAGLRIVW
jgi:hypothetical protein